MYKSGKKASYKNRNFVLICFDYQIRDVCYFTLGMRLDNSNNFTYFSLHL